MHKPLPSTRLGRWLAGMGLVLLASTGARAQLISETFDGSWTTPGTLTTPGGTGAWGDGGATGNLQWHRNDYTTGWTSTSGNPGATGVGGTGSYARFHTYDATSGTSGSLMSPTLDLSGSPGSKAVTFSLLNTSGSDVVNVYLSTDGGATYGSSLGQFGVYAAFTQVAVNLGAVTSSTVKIKFTATSDYGTTDIGLDNFQLVAATPICGTKAVGPTGDYASLTAALAAVSLNGVCGPLVLELQSTYASTVETFPIAYPYAGGSATNTVTVRPAAGATGLSITGASTAAILNLSGGRYFVLDGRPGGSGTTVSGAAATTDLTLANTSTSGSTLSLANDATNNVVEHCQLRGVGTSAASYPVVSFSSSAATTGNSSNTVQYNAFGAGATTPAGFVYSGSTLNAANSLVGNTLADCYYASATSYAVYLSSAGNNWTISSNSFYQTASRTAVAYTNYAIYVASGGGHTIANNAIGGSGPATISTTGAATLAGTWTVGTGTAAAYRFVGIYLNGSTTASAVTNNTVGSMSWYSSSGATTAPGVWAGSYLLSNANVSGNTIGGGVTVTTTTSGAISYGLVSSTGPTTLNLSGNTIAGLTAAGSATGIAASVAGIQTSGTTNNIYQNKIYGLTAGNAGVATGILPFAGTTTTIYNNLVGNLTAPASTSLTAVAGFSITAGTAVNAYYNTIYLNASSTGATFGTAGIFLNSTATTLDARNNLVVNLSTAAGTGGYTAAFSRVSGTAGTVPANYAATSNNNLFYAGTPSATNLIYVEGTTTATNAQQTLAAYKAFMVNRDQQAVTENPPFVSTTGSAATFLHIGTGTATQVESGALPVSGITTDYDGDTRNASTPDIGADEGSFTPQDLTGPAISFTALGNSSNTTSRTLTATITDVSGISTSAPPRLFYRKGTSGAFTSALATSSSGGSYTFTLSYAALGGVAAGDVVQYYVVAQDGPGNVSSNPGGGTFTSVPANVYQYTILGALSGTYYVGSGTSPDASRTYATLTAAASAYNASGLGGPVTFLLLDATYSTAETFPIAFGNNAEASATNTLTIRPAAGVSSTIASTASGLAFVNARYVVLDGANASGATTRNLTVSTTSATAGSYVVGLISTATTGPGNQYVTVRNTNVVGGSNTVATYGLYVGNGPDNDNVTLANNSVQGVYYGIYAFGSAPASAGGMDNFVVAGNVVGPATASTAANIGTWGILVNNAVGAQITGNEVQNVSSANASNIYGLYLVDTKGAVVSRNSLHNLSYTGASTYKVWAIHSIHANLATAANPSAVRLDNNLVYNITSTTVSSTWNTVGINLGGGYGDQVVYNSVYLSGQLSAASGTAGSAAFANGNQSVTTSSTNVDVRNNIFSIVGGTGGTSSTPLYAHYEYNGTVAGSTLNYNDLYATAGATGLAVVGHLGSSTSTGDYTTLATWQAATSQEASSVSVDPQFAQTTAVPYNLTPANLALNNAGTPISGVTVDYTGATRGTTPDIGAYEFTPLTNDLAPAALLTPAATSTCYGPAEAVSVSVRNAGTASLSFATSPATVTVVVTLPGGTTQTLTTTLTTGTLASGATQAVTLPGTLDMSAVGTYSFAITATVQGDGNTSNDLLTPAPTRTVAAPVVGALSPAATSLCVSGTATLTLAGAANGSVQYQSSADGTTFIDIAGATSASYTTPVLTATTYYRAQVRCNTGVATSNVSTITVSNPQVASTNGPVAICAGSSATLTATASAGAAVRFFSAATGGTALATTTAGSYTTPALTASTTYYAEAYSGGSETVGKTTSIQTDGGYSGGGVGLVFTATGPTTIQTATVYNATTTAGSVSVELRDNASGTLITTVGPFTVAAGSASTLIPTVLPLSLAVPTAGTYRLVTAATPTPPTLYRDFSSGNTYPFTSPSGTISITGGYISGASSTYYFFYNLSISNECVGGATRTPIQVNVTQPATASFPAATASTCGGTGYQLAGTVGGSATTGTYSSSGTGTFSPSATTLNATYLPSAADIAAGSVTLTLSTAASGGCPAATATLALSISPAPVATFSYPATTTYCANSAGTVTPTLGAGATAGTFSSTTGLTIDAATGVIALGSSTAGTYTVTNTIAASGPCAATAATTTVTITPATSAAFSYAAASYCQTGGTNPTPTVTGTAGGTFSSTAGLSISATTGAINLSASTVGTYTVTYTVAGACGSAATATVAITAGQVATFSYPATTTYCAGAASTIAPTVTGAAGTFTASPAGLTINATTGVITLSSSTAGTYTVTNTVAASGGCAAATATATVTITPATSATFAYGSSTYCVSGTTNPAPTVTGTTGGTFSATTGLTINATTGSITLASSTPGAYTVTYTVAGPCGSSATATVVITAAPLASFTYPTTTTYCAGSAGTVAPTLGMGATAGTFTASPAGLSLNAATGAITLSTSAAGTYTVTNTIAASSGCAAATATATVTVTPATSAAFSYGGTSYCVSGTANPAATVAGTAGGTFSSTTGLSLNATTGAITLSASTPGTYTVTYTVAGPCGSSSTQTLTITAAPLASFSYPAAGSNCAGSAGTVAATLGTGATAGTFSSTTGLTLNASTGAVNLATSVAGTYTVTNTVAASGGCAVATATATITVNPTPATPTLTATGTSATGITLTSSAATGNQFYLNGVLIQGATAQTYLVNSGTRNGLYTVVVTNATGCSSAASAAVNVTVTATAGGLLASSLRVYPNPTPNGQVTLELSGLRGATQLTVLDAVGRVVLSESLPASSGTVTHALDLSGAATGVYLLRLSSPDGVEVRRLTRE